MGGREKKQRNDASAMQWHVMPQWGVGEDSLERSEKSQEEESFRV